MAATNRVATILAAAAMLTSAVPAGADPRHGDGRGGRHHRSHDKDGDGVGGFVLGALIAGGLVAALSSKKEEPKPLPDDVAFVPVSATDEPLPAEADEESAVAACVASAEGRARASFPIAQVATVRSVEPVGPGFSINGDMLVRASYREPGETHPFRCSVDAEAVKDVAVDGLALASR